MKTKFSSVIGCIILILIIYSCQSSDGISSQNVSSKEKTIILKIERLNDTYLISRIDSSAYDLPENLIKELTASVNLCSDCFFESIKRLDTIYLDLSVERYISGFELTDINFDGFIDIRFPSESTCCSGNNVINQTWISKNGSFYKHKVLSEIAIWNINKEAKQLESGWHMGAYDYYKVTYKFIDDSLKSIHEIKSSLLRDSIQRTIESTLVNDSWKVDSSFVNIFKP
jgi:hypothetical protein